MKRSQYIRPSLRYLYIDAETLLCNSTYQVIVSHDEGTWEADANLEGNWGSIWDTGLWDSEE